MRAVSKSRYWICLVVALVAVLGLAAAGCNDLGAGCYGQQRHRRRSHHDRSGRDHHGCARDHYDRGASSRYHHCQSGRV